MKTQSNNTRLNIRKTFLILSSGLILTSSNIFSDEYKSKVVDEASLMQAIATANTNNNIKKIVFKENTNIQLTTPVVYTGAQSIKLIGNNTVIDGSKAGSFVLDEDLTARTKDGTLVFNTSSDVSISGLTIKNSATRGIVVNIPEDSTGDDITIKLNKVNIINSALYGLHVDDNSDEFDDGDTGSAIGIDLIIKNSSINNNGIGALDFDGLRVDERSEGDIEATIVDSHINGNGGDGIELDEGGTGDVESYMNTVTINDNGFYNEEDFDDGFDIDETGEGDIDLKMVNVEINNNKDESLDVDETDAGDIKLKLKRVMVSNSLDEGIRVDEEGPGNIKAKLNRVKVIDGNDDGIELNEIGDGTIKLTMKKVETSNNKKFGISVKQWFVEDELESVEKPGVIKTKKVLLNGNGKGDEIEVNNMAIK